MAGLAHTASRVEPFFCSPRHTQEEDGQNGCGSRSGYLAKSRVTKRRTPGLHTLFQKLKTFNLELATSEKTKLPFFSSSQGLKGTEETPLSLSLSLA